MSPSTYVMLSGIVTCGVPLALAVHEIWSLRRRPTANDGPPPTPTPTPTPTLPKPLPDCLMPQPVAARIRERVREDA